MSKELPQPDETKAGVERSEYRVVTRVFSTTERGKENALKFVKEELEKRYPTMDEYDRVDLFEGYKEIYVNAHYHGNSRMEGQVGDYLGPGKQIPENNKSIIVTLKFAPKKFTVSVQDEGKGFDIEKVRSGIRDVLGAGHESPHHRGIIMIRQFQYGLPVEVEFAKDEQGQIQGTRVTLTRDFNVELPITNDVEDYIVEV